MTGELRNAWTRGIARIAPPLRCAAGCLMLVALGCAGSRQSIPAPRERDAGTLRAEAASRPLDAEPCYQLALLHSGAGAADSALASIGAALRRDANHAPSLALLAKLLHDARRSADGVKYFESRGTSTLPDAVRIDVALLYADVGNTRKARKLLESAQSGPYAAEAAVNLAYLDLLDEENTAALAKLEASGSRFADTPEVQLNLALARLRAGEVDQGAELLQRVAKDNDDFGPAQLNLSLLLHHYLFDTDGATRAKAHFDALGGIALGDAAIAGLPSVEDAAPRLPPTTPAPDAGGKP